MEWTHDGEFTQYTRGEWLTDEAVAVLIEGGALSRLRGLRLQKLTPVGLEKLLTSPHAEGLDVIEVEGSFTSTART